MCYDSNRRISATTNLKKAAFFTDSGKAYNVLNHGFPKGRRAAWQVTEISEREGDTQPMRCETIEADVCKALTHTIDWPEITNTLEDIYREVLAYRTELQQSLLQVESELFDCEHACEFLKLDAAKGYKLYRMMHASRMNRRFLKDELRRVGAVIDNGAVSTASGKLQNVMKEIDSQVYTPRVLKELFNG